MPMQPDVTDEQMLFQHTAVSLIEAGLPMASGSSACPASRAPTPQAVP
ncbi:MAG TPA: hypothetical protein VHZ03_02980 [Trebonia sp.]|jgi:hypothetical protein|nr:hypothetical protein [Trebonia sp.]